MWTVRVSYLILEICLNVLIYLNIILVVKIEFKVLSFYCKAVKVLLKILSK